MAKFKSLEPGTIGLIMQDETGRIFQLALTEELNKTLQLLLASISREAAFIKTGEEHDLVLKASLCKKCKS